MDHAHKKLGIKILNIRISEMKALFERENSKSENYQKNYTSLDHDRTIKVWLIFNDIIRIIRGLKVTTSIPKKINQCTFSINWKSYWGKI